MVKRKVRDSETDRLKTEWEKSTEKWPNVSVGRWGNPRVVPELKDFVHSTEVGRRKVVGFFSVASGKWVLVDGGRSISSGIWTIDSVKAVLLPDSFSGELGPTLKGWHYNEAGKWTSQSLFTGESRISSNRWIFSTGEEVRAEELLSLNSWSNKKGRAKLLGAIAHAGTILAVYGSGKGLFAKKIEKISLAPPEVRVREVTAKVKVPQVAQALLQAAREELEREAAKERMVSEMASWPMRKVSDNHSPIAWISQGELSRWKGSLNLMVSKRYRSPGRDVWITVTGLPRDWTGVGKITIEGEESGSVAFLELQEGYVLRGKVMNERAPFGKLSAGSKKGYGEVLENEKVAGVLLYDGELWASWTNEKEEVIGWERIASVATGAAKEFTRLGRKRLLASPVGIRMAESDVREMYGREL